MVFQSCEFFPERNRYIIGINMPKFWVDKVEEMDYKSYTVAAACRQGMHMSYVMISMIKLKVARCPCLAHSKDKWK